MSNEIEVKEVFTIFDLETTGLDPAGNQITEIAAIRTDLEKEYGRMELRVTKKPDQEYPQEAIDITGLTLDELKGGVPEALAVILFTCFISGSTVVAQHAAFDLGFLARYQIQPDMFICTRVMSKLLDPDKSASLNKVCERRGIELAGHHRAMNDVEATAKLFGILKAEADARGIYYRNTVINDAERPLSYIPPYSHVLEK